MSGNGLTSALMLIQWTSQIVRSSFLLLVCCSPYRVFNSPLEIPKENGALGRSRHLCLNSPVCYNWASVFTPSFNDSTSELKISLIRPYILQSIHGFTISIEIATTYLFKPTSRWMNKSQKTELLVNMTATHGSKVS